MGELYADIIVDISHEKLDKPFQYRVPDRLRDRLETGMCVTVPFGNGNRLIKGYVVDIGDTCKFDPGRIKEIQAVSRGDADVEDKMIALAGWIRKNYGSTMIQALKTVLPARKTVKKLEHRTIRRVMNREEILSLLGESIRKKQVAKERLLRELTEQETIPYEWVTGKLGVSAQTVKSLEKAGAVRILSTQSLRNPVRLEEQEERRRILSAEQIGIVGEVLADFDAGKPDTYLLHGITGSGKTEVYMKIIEEMVDRGKQAIVLIPEIALTYQTLLRFFRRFGHRVSVMNSTLSPGEKFDQCERARKGEIDVIIGPRSALFTPFPNLGIIVIDEEHENSYKSESSPKYHARETALEVARLHGASVLLGSATPSLEAYYRAESGEYKLFVLRKRLTGGDLPAVHIVDLRKELREGNRSIFSGKLQELLADRISRGEQSILFLNRRGYAGFVSCRACGYVVKCPHCDVSLSEHRGMRAGNGAGAGKSRMICHYCGYDAAAPEICPQCGSRYISGFRAGTQQIEEKLRDIFPKARILRMDADTTRTKDSYERILSAFSGGEADVLIGTQMIVKGHDFPQVTLVGVLAADLSLNSNDYRACERTFQLLTQAVGRAGRGTIPGEAVIQTYQPEHYAILRAAEQDYEGFYKEEILYREMLGYPPAAHMLAVQIFAGEEERGRAFAGRLAGIVRQMFEVQMNPRESRGYKGRERMPELQLIGPAPASVGKINDIFRFVFYVKCADYGKLVQVKDLLEEEIQKIQPVNESVQFDFDPVNMM
ncbi:replication restart helicase PriA [Acetatifactor muris]|uniref:replication restart helicase PriA n=1 Tax=Acetatifactor muris TaxID=879566 RepID=UPI0023F00922|nr:primosomal protein N' [Acetatifactor muris]